ncbi:MAG TPA: AmmeMemoRadiSam system protein A [Brevefilum sp.]|nr:AmmeMemoRadiSam system protein A [Brevefilum sp.]HOR19619.1 AmmeMemoRadiSam system protein A [Brevefilum sp.]HPL70235.1 AmmeMemoRadiSam system protein A [Brevefilum sp.]
MKLNQEEQTLLLQIARQSLENAVLGKPLPELDLAQLSPSLVELGASFVTLTIDGRLRGCIGTLEANHPLARDVQVHAVAAGLKDYRFDEVQAAELPLIKIEISVLTTPSPLDYDHPQDLVAKLKPSIDGVILQDGLKKATFLPQVWDKLPNPEVFLYHLCQKMGAEGDVWRKKLLKVFVYQVLEFQE